jgi:hypothetical protein
MEDPDLVPGVLFVCGAIMFLTGYFIIIILHALDEDDKYKEE